MSLDTCLIVDVWLMIAIDVTITVVATKTTKKAMVNLVTWKLTIFFSEWGMNMMVICSRPLRTNSSHHTPIRLLNSPK